VPNSLIGNPRSAGIWSYQLINRCLATQTVPIRSCSVAVGIFPNEPDGVRIRDMDICVCHRQGSSVVVTQKTVRVLNFEGIHLGTACESHKQASGSCGLTPYCIQLN